MRVYNTYILSLVLAASVINIFLAFLGQKDIQVYFVINIITYLVITLLHVYLNPRARQALNAIGAVLFAGFMVIVSLKVIDIIVKK